MEEFFFFGGLMVAVMLLFVFLSWRYEDMPHLSKEIISLTLQQVQQLYTSLEMSRVRYFVYLSSLTCQLLSRYMRATSETEEPEKKEAA